MFKTRDWQRKLMIMGKKTIYNSISIYLLCSVSTIITIKVPNLDEIGSEKLDDCKRCKVLTDSFNTWLEKTSRGKYEGGDAAWEEAKLKSYVRSEVRLVEIQEGLCSDLKKSQDHCYSLAEEAEQALEKWWFQNDPSSADLYTWLCIDTLQFCCPQNHFGAFCEPCPLDSSNNICGGKGKCDGEGTRQGKGGCVCNRGYTGKNCEDCAKNFYNASSGFCELCHKSCDGCTGEGADKCNSCKSGWKLENGACVDIDECLDSTTCKADQFCVNKQGSHACKLCDRSCRTCFGAGPSSCKSCEPTHTLWSGSCFDNKIKNDVLLYTLKKWALYFGLLITSIFVFKNSKILASFIVLVAALLFYILEKSNRFSTSDVFINYFR